MTTECDSCKRTEGTVNHVPGHIFVGWGHGWQACTQCGGRGILPAVGDEIALHYHWFDALRGRVTDVLICTIRRLERTANGTLYASVEREGGGGYDAYLVAGEWHHGH